MPLKRNKFSVMRNVIKSFVLIFIVIQVSQSRAETALDHRLGVEMGWTYNHIDNALGQKLDWLFYNGGYYPVGTQVGFSRDENDHVFSVAPEYSFWDQDGFSGHLRVDCTWESDPDTDEDAGELDLTLAYVSMSSETLTLDLGHKPVQFGNGLIMLHDAPTASVELYRGNTFMTLQVARLEDNSPMAGLSIGMRPGEFEHLALFGVWFEDNDDIFGKSFALNLLSLENLKDSPNLRFLEIESSGELYWIGAAADLFVGPAYLTAVGALQSGRIHLKTPNLKHDMDTTGYFADLDLELNLTQETALGVFCFVASGDNELIQGDSAHIQNDFNAALSIMAFNPKAAIFFAESFMDRDDSETFAYSGVTHSGVIAPGLTLAVESGYNLSWSVTAATFYAHRKLSEGSRWYGWETDLGLNYTFGGRYKLYATAARFEHGDYFESVLGTKPHAAILLTVGVNVNF